MVVVSVLILFLCFASFEVVAATKMPSFALESVRDGKIIESSSFKGKVLLLTFFATWCPPCAQEVPVLNQLGLRRQTPQRLLRPDQGRRCPQARLQRDGDRHS